MLKDKIVIITGASQGLGRELSIKLAGLGAKVAMVARNEKLLGELKAEINGSGGESEFFACDITDYDQVKNTVSKIMEKFGNINILFNGAGIYTTDEFEETRPELIENAFKVNAIGHIYFIKTVLPFMKKVNKGHIFNVISIAGLESDANKDYPTYTATKWAMTGYTKALKHGLVGTKIKVTAFYPSGFESSIFETLGETTDAHNQPWMMKTADVADAVIYALNQPDELSIDSIEMSKNE